MFITLIR